MGRTPLCPGDSTAMPWLKWRIPVWKQKRPWEMVMKYTENLLMIKTEQNSRGSQEAALGPVSPAYK